MIRRIVHIDEEKCTGCGACAEACHEGAIAIVEGKAKLMRDDYCDGLGDCLPSCPAGAISFVERECDAYDHEAVLENMRKKQAAAQPAACPGMRVVQLKPRAEASASADEADSCLSQWPVQLKLAPVKAPYFDGCRLLIAADCTAYAYASFHERFMLGHVTLIACTKLDAVDYTDKLTEILRSNNIASVSVARMEVPCCGALDRAVRNSIAASGKNIPVETVTISTGGKILEKLR